jgi:AraC family transcriptional regulator of adaptative response / DNA-3-methyladenine glycosylase II
VRPIPGLTERALDRARASRDARFDGRFFIAVTSTRIYCRPICPAPSPKRANVRYYATAAAAIEAGFRPCLRCRPEAAPGSPAWRGTSAIVSRALRLIDDGVVDRGSVASLAARVGVGPRHLHRLFVQHVGASPATVAHTRRLLFAKRLIDETHLPLTQVALAAGFRSLRRFNDTFQVTYGRSPRELRKRRRTSLAPATREAVVLRLAYRPPYDWEHITGFLSRRALPGVERVDRHEYARTIAIGDGHAVVTVRPIAGEPALELRVLGAPPASLFSIAATARRVFDLGCDPAGVRAALRHDPLLGRLASTRPGIRIPGAWDPFECAVRAVLGQQVSLAAGRTFVSRLVDLAGRPCSTGIEGLTRVFPTPAAVAGADLSNLGLTAARTGTLRALARAVASGTVDVTRPSDEVMAALTSLPGIGDWTAQYVALRALGEPDAFPSGDLVLRRQAGGLGRPLTTASLMGRAEAWRPWRGYAVMLLWLQAELAATAPTREGRVKRARKAPTRPQPSTAQSHARASL